MIVTLIGYRGTGKSSVAPVLAQRLGLRWSDADVELERRAGQTIREIFAEQGEPRFRRMERLILSDLLHYGDRVIAAGGGAILDPDTRREFRAAGPVVWLQADVNTIAQRLAADASTAASRPSLTAAGGIEEIRTVLAAREPLYRETATIVVETTGKSVDAIVGEIVAALPVSKPGGPA
jgi:shikimate kinase